MEILQEIEKYITNEKPIQSFKLKNKLLKLKLKEYKCERCGIETWNGFRIPLDLHHIDGNNNNNNLSNLEILCPNCHAQTDNFRGKNVDTIKRKRISELEYKKAIEENVNIRRTCIALGISPRGGNYRTIRNAIERLNVNFRQMTNEEKAQEIENRRKKSLIHDKLKRDNVKNRRNKYATKEEAMLALRKVKNRPTKQELLEMVWNTSVAKIAKGYGVSDNSVRKWAEKYKIPVPPVGYWRKFELNKKEECEKIKSDLFIKFSI